MEFEEFLALHDAALKAHEESFRCAHKVQVLTARIVKGGGKQIVYQCQQCGDSDNQPVAHKKVQEVSDGLPIPPFDYALRSEWKAQRKESLIAINQRFSREAFRAAEERYLKTPRWRAMRALVLSRAKGKCEGCGTKAATEVHHLNYDHAGNELLFELVALCRDCHKRIHARGNALFASILAQSGWRTMFEQAPEKADEEKPANFGQPWTPELDDQLWTLANSRASEEDIAAALGRSVRSIALRLEHLTRVRTIRST